MAAIGVNSTSNLAILDQDVPPLTQSMYETMACPASYQAIYQHGAQQMPNPLGALSQEIHALMMAYVSHLRDEGLEEDWRYFESILPCISTDAQAIVSGVIGKLKFDPRAILTTEIRFRFPDATGKPDLVTLETPTDATIWDYKNYFIIIEPNTFQSKLYPLLMFRHNPVIETVRFVLVFLRYGVTREVTWHRDQMPYLENALATARAAQHNIHETKGLAQAIPGKACDYCPLLNTRRCQVNEWNPRAAMSDADRLLYVIYLRAALRAQMGILRERAQDRAIVAYDNNRNQYTGSYELKQKRTLPLNPALEILDRHKAETGEDLRVRAGISRTSLASLRSAQKRATLDKALTAIETAKESTAFAISRVNPELPPDDEY